MKRTIFLTLLLWVLPYSASAEDITVAMASNLQYTFGDLKKAFEKDHPDVTMKQVVGSSSYLVEQIENGAPFDIFMSADMLRPLRLYLKDFASQRPKVFTYTSIILWTLKPLDLTRGIDILKDPSIKKIVIPDPERTANGRQIVKILEYYNIYNDILPKLIYGENFTLVNQMIMEQAVDIGITVKSVVMEPAMKSKGTWIDVNVNDKSFEPLAQGAVILKHGKDNSKVRLFYDFLFSQKAKEIFKKYGYKVPVIN